MAVPDYQTVMLPLLEHLGDKAEKATRETKAKSIDNKIKNNLTDQRCL